jgi:HPt (histidine-containing phosphotransfer) domain-containing protein
MEEALIPVDLEDLAKDFLENRRNELAELRSLVEQADFKKLEQIAHKIKGNGGSFGFPRISEIGKRLEYSAQAHLRDECAKAVDDLKNYLANVKVVIDRNIAS